MSSLHIRAIGAPSVSAWARTTAQLRDLAASLNPTPGGGSISILTATLGLALVHKGASISLKRAGEDHARREALSALCKRIITELASVSGLVDADAQAFQSYLRARSIPRATETEQSERKAAMEAGILQATRVPLAAASEVCSALELAESTVELSDLHLLTDVFGGVLLMQAAVKAALLTVDANLGSISDLETRAGFLQERAQLEERSDARFEAISQVYQAPISAQKDAPGSDAPGGAVR